MPDWTYWKRLDRLASDDVAGYFRTRGGVFEEWHADVRAWLPASELAVESYSRSIRLGNLMIDRADPEQIETL